MRSAKLSIARSLKRALELGVRKERMRQGRTGEHAGPSQPVTGPRSAHSGERTGHHVSAGKMKARGVIVAGKTLSGPSTCPPRGGASVGERT
eukprot:CAMPEP_0202099854 /NCGR_PEP_ID=MMETSP0965-20130614/2792_1 /ASSEMBLY_ACC=CAM_ASM_000507 /TAXON_ID=4773 /ORGANISM="Schizochytrium aggregatum, Strain ATCC28209" /LENGTH=91 /DNA_ID=CAMNT_0048668471 /DNA_START=28 /DNA_END=300 /DNA_ORIENTATION=-